MPKAAVKATHIHTYKCSLAFKCVCVRYIQLRIIYKHDVGKYFNNANYNYALSVGKILAEKLLNTHTHMVYVCIYVHVDK